MEHFKDQILIQCKLIIAEKINSLNDALKDITDSANNESKSSAGDKHETGRAMMQIEQEKLGKQIQEWETQKNILDKMDLTKNSNSISLGSLIETNKGLFFIAANVGKIKVNEKEIIVISMQSPLGTCFVRYKEGDEFEFNEVGYTIMHVG
jgi:hypothetical protein